MKPRLVIGRRPHAWLAVLFAALFAAGLGAQMPDPRQMSGQVLPSADLPTGSVTVRVIRQTMANAAPGIEVELHGAGEVRRATTGQQGRAQFDGLPLGARVHVVAVVDGERLESIEFPVPGSGGARTLARGGRRGWNARERWRTAGTAASVSAGRVIGNAEARRRYSVCDRVPGRSTDGVLPARVRESRADGARPNAGRHRAADGSDGRVAHAGSSRKGPASPVRE